MTSRALLALQRAILRSARPLRPLWSLLYRATESAGAAYLARGERGTTVYARGAAVGGDDFLPGLSDVDLVVVTGPDGAKERIRRRWDRLSGRLPGITRVLDNPRVHDEEFLRSIAGSSILTYEGTAFMGERGGYDPQRALQRPGLYGPFDGWRRLRGPDRLPAGAEPAPEDRPTVAWLELIYFWRMGVGACVGPQTPRSADVCLKLLSETARSWLWAAHGRRAGHRGDALEAAMALLPEEERGLSRALALRRELSSAPAAPWEELLPVALRMTARVAETMELGGRTVRLAGAAGDPRLMPLVDWKALASPAAAEESFFAVPASPGDPAALRAAAQAHPAGEFPALFEHGLMVIPSLALVRTWRTTIQCPVSDPVSFALQAGRDTAEFSAAPGWRVEHIARRAVLEHRAWMRTAGHSPGQTLQLLLTAARASLFATSLESGEPELCLTVAEIAARLPGSVGGDVLAAHRALAATGAEPEPRLLGALRETVGALPGYAEPSASIRSSTAGRSSIT